MVWPCAAQGWPRWADEAFGNSGPSFGRGWNDRAERPEERPNDEVRSGGARPDIAPVAPPIVAFPYDYPANSIVIDTGKRALYYVLADKQAYRYAIGVGREGFSWAGSEKVSRKQDWPDWHPPAEMRQRDPHLPLKMTGGISNPLGARAIYLGDTLYRIHGTNDERSIGRAEVFRVLPDAEWGRGAPRHRHRDRHPRFGRARPAGAPGRGEDVVSRAKAG